MNLTNTQSDASVNSGPGTSTATIEETGGALTVMLSNGVDIIRLEQTSGDV